MKYIEIPMWTKGRKRLLSWVLENVAHPEKLDWTLRYFSGVGDFLFDRSVEKFQNHIESGDYGYWLSFENLMKFSMGMQDITEIDLVGRKDDEPVINIVGEDSTRWIISYRNDWFSLKEADGPDSNS